MGQRAFLLGVAMEETAVLRVRVEAAADGYRLVGGIGEYEASWRMAFVWGPEQIIVLLAERIG